MLIDEHWEILVRAHEADDDWTIVCEGPTRAHVMQQYRTECCPDGQTFSGDRREGLAKIRRIRLHTNNPGAAR